VNWIDGPLANFDIESTGLDVEVEQIITACVAVVPAAGGPRTPVVHSWLAIPRAPIPAEATAVHGITTEHAATHGRDAADVVFELTDMLAGLLAQGVPVVGANLQYDLTLLDRECRRYGHATLGQRLGRVAPVIDIMVIDKAVDRYRKGPRKLIPFLTDHYRVPVVGDAHDSTTDALAAGRIAWRQATAGPVGKPGERIDVGAMSLDELHDAQVRWKVEQSRGLASHFRRQASMAATPQEAQEYRDKADSVRPEWPFIPADDDKGTGGGDADGRLF
jgi:DNA polymerase-3 subunit epsilon